MMTICRNLLLAGLLLLVPCGCAPDASSEPSSAAGSTSGAGLKDVATPEIAPQASPAAATTEAMSPVGTSEAASPAATTEATTTVGTTEPATPEPAAPNVVTLELLEWDGVKEIIESHKGKVVVVDCWATYCVPCRKEFPGLVQLSRELSSDVVCISVSLDDPADQDAALVFLNEQKARITNILCTTDADTLYDQILKVGSIPAIFVYGRDGAIARTFTGANPDGGEYTYAGHITPFVRELASQN